MARPTSSAAGADQQASVKAGAPGVDRLAAGRAGQVRAEHRRQSLLPGPVPPGGGQRAALPRRPGLPSGRARRDDLEQAIRLRRGYARADQALPRAGQQLGHQVGREDRPDVIAAARRPAQLGAQAVLGGPVEIVVSPLERQRADPPRVPLGQPKGQPDQKGGIGQHVRHGRPGGQGAQLDPQMAARRGVVDGPVPAPYRALVEPQLVQARRAVLVFPGPGGACRRRAAADRTGGRSRRTVPEPRFAASPCPTWRARAVAAARGCRGLRPTA